VGSLSKVQKQVVLGCILGDGYMRKKSNAHLQITHSYKQKDYVDWKYEILKDFVLTKPKKYEGNLGRVGYRFFTRSLPEFTSFYNKFYKNKIKIIPKNLSLTPLSLAVWYMDDGCKSYKSCYLNTQQFDKESQLNLMNSLNKIGLESRLNKDKIYQRIRITTESTKKMFGMINKYIISSMYYKISI